MSNINDSYFDGYYKDIWRSIIPETLTLKELDFIINFFNLQSESVVLDIMCGYGRHAIELARRGMDVTAIDNLAEYIKEVQDIASKESLNINAVCEDVINFRPNRCFDLIICMGNSLNFFNPYETAALLKSLCSCLKKGGSLLINTWSLAEIALLQFEEKSEGMSGAISVITNANYLFFPARIEMETIITPPGKVSEIKKAVDYIFSVNEMENMLLNAGVKIQEIFSIPGKKKFTVGEPRAYIIAKKE